MRTAFASTFFVLCLSTLPFACGGGDSNATSSTMGAGGGATGPTMVDFDLDADTTKDFYASPWPSDLRLLPSGAPDVAGFPNPNHKPAVESVQAIVKDRLGFPVIPVALFRFDAPLAAEDSETVIPAKPSSAILLVDVDPKSPDRGTLYPTVATVAPPDDYVPANLLAVAARPGIVLAPHREYAFVVRKALGDAAGKPLGVPAALADLQAGKTPAGPHGPSAKKLYDALFTTPGMKDLDVAAATVFTTGDVVADLNALQDKVIAKTTITIDELHVDPAGGADHDRYCELIGTMTMPQFQTGKPPYNTDGVFELDKDGAPIVQRMEKVPLTITLPNLPMPDAGFPLDVYFHGSGGLSTEVVDRGKIDKQYPNGTPGEGPAYVIAPFGIAAAGSALPLNPERFKNATETEYLNLNNLAAFRDTFRQGAIEQRLYMAALKELEIDPSLVSACTGLVPPAGGKYKFDPDKLLAQGQSMGAMYGNLIASTEPRVNVLLPTGSGGFWTYFILNTNLIPGASGAVGELLLQTTQKLTFMHPALMLTETAWEPIDPIVFMPRVARRPLPGHPTRPIYEPVGKGDSYFTTEVYDAVALSFGHRQAGEMIWPTMQPALALEGLDGMLKYDVSEDVSHAEDSEKYTGVVVQYNGDGYTDPHYIFQQLDSVKYQYGCFFDSFLKTGKATVPAPAPLGTPCPGE